MKWKHTCPKKEEESLKKQGHSHTWHKGGLCGHRAKWNGPSQKDKCCAISLTWGTERSQRQRDRKERGGCQGLEGVGERSECLTCTVSVWDEEEVLEVRGGGSCVTVCTGLTPRSCTLKTHSDGQVHATWTPLPKNTQKAHTPEKEQKQLQVFMRNTSSDWQETGIPTVIWVIF